MDSSLEEIMPFHTQKRRLCHIDVVNYNEKTCISSIYKIHLLGCIIENPLNETRL
jgi:hypothetical protein